MGGYNPKEPSNWQQERHRDPMMLPCAVPHVSTPAYKMEIITIFAS